MFNGIPLIIDGIVPLLLTVLLISGIIMKKRRIIFAWGILAGIQFVLEIAANVFLIIILFPVLPKMLAVILKTLSQLTTLILTGLHYCTMNGGQAGEVIPMSHTG